ncbi:alpha/beta hydrolase-fold protein [Bacteroidota bacterium]
MKNNSKRHINHRIILIIFLFHLIFPVFGQQNSEKIIIGEHTIFHSEIFNEDWRLTIHLPKNYNVDKINYPVVYHLYGNNIYNYFSPAVNVLENLNSDGLMPAAILIGIANNDRYRDNLPLQNNGSPGGASRFLEFFKKELIPFIDENFNTNDYRMIIGPQAGSVFGLYTLMEDPEVFNAYILNNSFYNPVSGKYLINRIQKEFNKETVLNNFLYFKYESGNIRGLDMVERFKNHMDNNAPQGLNFIIVKKEAEGDFIEMMDIKRAFKTMFSEYKPPENFQVNDLNDLKDYYKKYSEKIGMEVDIPDQTLYMAGNKLVSRQLYDKAIELFKYQLKVYPESTNALFFLAETLRTTGELESAVQYYKRFLNLMNEDVSFVFARMEQTEKIIKSSASYAIEKIIRESGIIAGAKKFKQLKLEKDSDLYFDQREINLLGYKYLNMSKITEAIEIFKMNVILFPESANVYDSIAEAYMKQGDKKAAIKNYRKVIELDAENKNAKDMLIKLKK